MDQEEIFGPVGSFASFETLEEVIDRANDSLYGLAAGVWSSNINTCMAVADGVDAGTICKHTSTPPLLAISGYKFDRLLVVPGVNGMMSSWGYQAPFGGPKQTGGGRTNGKQGLEEYLISKTISINLNTEATKPL